MLSKTFTDIIKEAALSESFNTSDMINEELRSDYNSCIKGMPVISKKYISYTAEMIPVFEHESSYLVEMDNIVKYMSSNDIKDIREAMEDIARENGISMSKLALVVETKQYMNSVMESAIQMSKAGNKALLEDCELSMKLLNMLKEDGIKVVLIGEAKSKKSKKPLDKIDDVKKDVKKSVSDIKKKLKK